MATALLHMHGHADRPTDSQGMLELPAFYTWGKPCSASFAFAIYGHLAFDTAPEAVAWAHDAGLAPIFAERDYVILGTDAHPGMCASRTSKTRRATRDDAAPSFFWGFLLEGLSFFRLVNVCLRLAYSPLSRLVLSSSRIKQNDYSANMGRMHSKGKGMSKSSIPYKRSAPLWCKTSPDEIKDMIAKMAKKGMTPSQIGVILRDNHGIPQVSLSLIHI